MIKITTLEDKPKLLSIIQNSGQFDSESLEHVEQTLDAHFTNPVHELWFT